MNLSVIAPPNIARAITGIVGCPAASPTHPSECVSSSTTQPCTIIRVLKPRNPKKSAIKRNLELRIFSASRATSCRFGGAGVGISDSAVAYFEEDLVAMFAEPRGRVDEFRANHTFTHQSQVSHAYKRCPTASWLAQQFPYGLNNVGLRNNLRFLFGPRLHLDAAVAHAS